jgi:CelD/BcsL family acetyltransferase involved in cellulose biosynthesis
MRTTLMPLKGLGTAELASWRGLAASAAEPNPFYEPEYLLPLARALQEQDEIELAVVHEGERWLACLPVRRTARWHRIPLASLTAWRGRGLLPALLGTPLVDHEQVVAATAALLGELVAVKGARFVVLDGLVEDGPVHRAVTEALSSERLWSLQFSREDRAFVRRSAENDYLQARMQPKHLRYLRSQGRRLGKELGGELELIDRTGQDGAAADFVELEGASHLAERGEVIAADPAIAAFFAEMCEGFAAQGRLQLWALRAGERTVALKCNLLADPGVFYLKIAYDETLQKFSPGIQLEALALDLFHAREQSGWIDSCAFPNNETFNRLLPERRALVTLTIARRAPATLLAAPLIGLGKRMRDRAMAA